MLLNRNDYYKDGLDVSFTHEQRAMVREYIFESLIPLSKEFMETAIKYMNYQMEQGQKNNNTNDF